MGGGVKIQGDIVEAAEYDINTTSGDIEMEFPETAAAAINAHSVTGVLKCELDLINADGRANWIIGIYKAPTANLRFNSVSGDIRLTKQRVANAADRASPPEE
jgi:DUF4097 and DUF4098 domain-containing protein YvlB